MVLSRRIDDREILLKRQQKIFFQVSAAGHEALQVGAALALRPGYDWFFPYYRDRALCLALGVYPYDMFLQAVGAATDPASGGRQMPTHWSSRQLHIVSTSSSTATQLLHAVGCAEAGRYFSRHPEAAAKPRRMTTAPSTIVEFHGDEVVLTCIGEGSTSQGEFWEALNTASNQKLPVIFLVEDNGYAISVPVEVNTPGGNISRLVANFPNFHFAEIDGTDPEASLAAFKPLPPTAAPAWAPPSFTATASAPTPTRSLTTTSSTAPPPSARADLLRDPIARMQSAFFARAFSPSPKSSSSSRPSNTKLPKPPRRALEAPLPEISSIPQHVYSADLDPTSLLRHRADRTPLDSASCVTRSPHHGRPDQRLPPRRDAPRSAHRRLWRRRGRRQPRSRRWPRSKARAASSSSPPACKPSSAPSASSTRRWPRPTSSAAPSVTPSAA